MSDNRHSVLHFTNSSLWGGVEEHICGLLRGLSRESFRTHLVCDPVLFERFRAAIPEDVPITALALSSPKHVRSAVQFAKFLRRGSFDIVHSHMFWSSMFASPLAWACRVPAVLETLHGTEAWRSGWKANYVIDRATTPFISRYVAVCQSDARFLERRKGVAPNKITVIPNGIDVSRFAVSESTRAAARQRLGFEEKDPVLIVIARLHWGKGHRLLLDAMPQLLRSYPALKVVFLGEGAEAPQLRERCRVLGITNCVHMPGYQKNVQDWLAAADINVLPTLYEGLPLTILEAMAAGLPTVASNVGGIPDAIEDGRSGILVPPGESNCLAAWISSLLQNPDLRLRLAKAAHDRVVHHFTLEEQIVRTHSLYLDLCRGVGGVTLSSSSTSRAMAPPFSFVSVSGDDSRVGNYRSEHP